MRTNLILCSDSYKYSHPYLQAPGTQQCFFYVESRGGQYSDIVSLGYQYYLKEYLSKPITQADIDEAEEVLTLHGEPFYKEGWQYILDKYNGYLPLRIRAVPEGMVIPTHNILMSVENTDDKCFWLPGFIETLKLKVWYPITVASRSLFLKKMLLEALNKSADDPEAKIGFALLSFGYRGCSSEETAGIGGVAESLSFLGSDTLRGIMFNRDYYNCKMSAFSVPALEHSVVMGWGKENEIESYKNMLTKFAKPGTIVACVSDTYDLWNCIENMWNKDLKEQVIKSGAVVVIRPDSGIPHEVVLRCLQMLDKGYGHTVNSKGYKVLNHVKVLQGDGINEHSIPQILETVLNAEYSTESLVLGMGGGMLQANIDRDTCKFAMKLSAIKINDVWHNVCKDPITDPGKRSKAGRLDLVFRNGKYETVQDQQPDSIMHTIFENGKILVDDSLDTIRARVQAHLSLV